MSSTILYKFRSGTTFEALPLPGSAARLFDVKKAIVLAKKLDQGGALEFDLSIRDATTNEEYADETQLLPRGTRLVVQRLPAARGHGFLARMARQQYGGGGPSATVAVPAVAPSNFYTIDSRGQEVDEFVQSSVDDKELEALRAATNVDGATAARGLRPGAIAVAGRGGKGPASHLPPTRARPNADPELRDQENQQQGQPKKRATGIPRTFLNLSVPPVTSIDGGGEEATVPLLQPNAAGFQELVHRGGGQSESASGSKRNLAYAIQVTATDVPEYLQCAICHGVVRDAMILPWDPEGRTTCESCIRDGLTQSGFLCPLTRMEGVSPDDLLPNHALRKAADQFVKGVFAKMEEIDKQQVDEDDSGNVASNDYQLEADSGDKGIILTKRGHAVDSTKQDNDLFGDDDFGGDVFAVNREEKANVEGRSDEDMQDVTPNPETEGNSVTLVKDADSATEIEVPAQGDSKPELKSEAIETQLDETMPRSNPSQSSDNKSPQGESASPNESQQARREANRRHRGPPVGYSMGPAGGGAIITGPQGRTFHGDERSRFPRSEHVNSGHNRPHGGTENRRADFEGRDAPPHRRSPVYDRHQDNQLSEDADDRAVKRLRADSTDRSEREDDRSHRSRSNDRPRRDDRGGRGRGSGRMDASSDENGHGRSFGGRGGRGGRFYQDRADGLGGRFDDRGRGYRGRGRDGFGRGRGGYRGRGRF